MGGPFEFCENIMMRDYNKYHETNNLNTAAISKFCSTLLLIILIIRNKRRAARSLGMAARFVILPSYFDYIGALCLTYLLFGIFNVAGGSVREQPGVLALQNGVYRMFDEGLAFFLLQHGAGYHAMRTASLYAAIWGAVLFVTLCIVYNEGNWSFFLGNLVIVLVVVLFYSVVLLAPLQWLHKRPALWPFGMLQIVNSTCWVLIISMQFVEFDVSYCLMFFTRTVLEGVLEPVVIVYTLILDSEYWQGLGEQQHVKNPLAGVWDLHLDTAAAMGKQLSDMEQSSRRLPVIHFGLLDLDEHLGYVAGGLSRVYFGRLRNEMVAVKILFAMELTPRIVEAFYEEVQVLYELQHENVVQCLGVSVMPPAVCVVLEHCQYGSLYDYLYKIPKLSASNKGHRARSVEVDPDESRMTELSAFSGRPQVPGGGSDASPGKQPLHGDGIDTSRSFRPRVSSSSSSCTDLGREAVGNPVLTAAAAEEEDKRLNRWEEMADIRRSRASSIGGGERRSVTYNERMKQLLEGCSGGGTTSSVGWRASQDLSLLGGRASLHHDKQRHARHSPTGDDSGRSSTGVSIAPFQSTGSNIRLTLTSRPPAEVLPPVKGSEPKPSFTPLEKLRMVLDACRGLEFLHMNGYMHCDLKSPNFLVSNSKVVKVADLGEARDYTSNNHYSRLPNPSINWRPPEMMIPDVSLRSYTVASDVYGLAMVISEILLQEVPMDVMFRNSTPEECCHHLVVENRRPVLPEWVPSALKEVVSRAWATDPALRPPCGEIAAIALDCIVRLQTEDK